MTQHVKPPYPWLSFARYLSTSVVGCVASVLFLTLAGYLGAEALLRWLDGQHNVWLLVRFLVAATMIAGGALFAMDRGAREKARLTQEIRTLREAWTTAVEDPEKGLLRAADVESEPEHALLRPAAGAETMDQQQLLRPSGGNHGGCK